MILTILLIRVCEFGKKHYKILGIAEIAWSIVICMIGVASYYWIEERVWAHDVLKSKMYNF